MTETLLDIENLSISFPDRGGLKTVLHKVNLSMGAEKLGIVGESGSGKSTLGRAIMGLLPRSAHIECDKMKFQDIDLAAASAKSLGKLRGQRMAMILQDPKHALNPLIPVGEQIAECYRIHVNATRAEAREKALAMLEAVEIRSPDRVMLQYPHEVSGGMGQRIMIAMMLICNPELLIADEPTSALDASVKASVMDTMERLVEERGMGLIFISHDLRQVARTCDRVMIFYQGHMMETLQASELENAKHPYTRGLLNAVPLVRNRRTRLPHLDRDPTWLKG